LRLTPVFRGEPRRSQKLVRAMAPGKL